MLLSGPHSLADLLEEAAVLLLVYPLHACRLKGVLVSLFSFSKTVIRAYNNLSSAELISGPGVSSPWQCSYLEFLLSRFLVWACSRFLIWACNIVSYAYFLIELCRTIVPTAYLYDEGCVVLFSFRL